MSNFLSMMQKAYSMKKTMNSLKKELDRLSVTGVSDGDLVTVTMRGNGTVISIDIDDSLLDTQEKAGLVDCLLFAFNDATDKIEVMKKEKMKDAMGGMSMGDLEGLL